MDDKRCKGKTCSYNVQIVAFGNYLRYNLPKLGSLEFSPVDGELKLGGLKVLTVDGEFTTIRYKIVN